MLQRYPDLSTEMPRNADGSGAGTLRCKSDLSSILEDIILDVEQGGNYHTTQVANQYINQTTGEIKHIRLQVWQSEYAHERLGHYAKQAVIGTLDSTNTEAIITGDWGITQENQVQYTPTGATYDPATGDMVLTVAPNAGSYTATNATYNPSTGLMVLTIGSHTLTTKDKIKLAENSISFSCNPGTGVATKSYPRSSGANTIDGKDYAYNRILDITAADATTITVNVNGGQGAISNTAAHTFVSAVANGITVAHDFIVGDAITIAQNGLTFTCAMDGNSTNHTYPRTTDPFYNKNIYVTAVTTTSITVNVGVTPLSYYDITNAAYTPATGVMVLTIGSHSLTAGTSIKLADEAITLTCDYNSDGWTTPKSYPRSTIDQMTAASGTTYNPTTGIVNITKSTHGLETGDLVKLADDSLTFSCDTGSGAVNKTYPRSTDPISGKWIPVTKVDANNFTIQVLETTPSTNTNAHTWVSAVTNGISAKRDRAYDHAINIDSVTDTTITINVGPSTDTSEHRFVSAKDNSVIVGGNYAHTFVSATTNAVTRPADCVNVQTTIDTLVNTLNDIIAPKGDDFEIAADRLYFNRKYIAAEITGLTTAEFTYTLNGINYSAFSYPGTDGEATCQRDLKEIIKSIISDLQTGGNNSTITAIRLYLNANQELTQIEDELLATIFAIEKLKTLGEYAIKNNLLAKNSSPASGKYVALHTTETPYTDSETPTDTDSIVQRLRDLVNLAVDMLAPGGTTMRSAAKQILFNENYYESELQNLVDAQFGAGTWTYDNFVSEITTNVSHDLITTNIHDKSHAIDITLTSVTGDFTAGEIVVSSNSAVSGKGYAKCLEFDEDVPSMVVGPFFSNTSFAVGDVLTGQSSGATATVAANGVSAVSYTHQTLPTKD